MCIAPFKTGQKKQDRINKHVSASPGLFSTRRLPTPESEPELEEEVENLGGATDGEAGEEPEGAADGPELRLHRDLLVLLDLVVRGRVEEDVDQLEGQVGLLAH